MGTESKISSCKSSAGTPFQQVLLVEDIQMQMVVFYIPWSPQQLLSSVGNRVGVWLVLCFTAVTAEYVPDPTEGSE